MTVLFDHIARCDDCQMDDNPTPTSHILCDVGVDLHLTAIERNDFISIDGFDVAPQVVFQARAELRARLTKDN